MTQTRGAGSISEHFSHYFYRRMTSGNCLHLTADKSTSFRSVGVDLSSCSMPDFERANLDLQPLDAPDFIPSGSTVSLSSSLILRGQQ